VALVRLHHERWLRPGHIVYASNAGQRPVRNKQTGRERGREICSRQTKSICARLNLDVLSETSVHAAIKKIIDDNWAAWML